MGRKGLGKLAGFGVARVVEVRTVHEGWLTHFLMDFEKMTSSGQAELVESYEPEILADEETDEASGTKVVLRDLQLSRAVDESSFRDSMSRRFSVLNKGFAVYVNDRALDTFDADLEFRFEGQDDGWEDVKGVGSVKWWIGFTEKPIKNDALRGVSVLVRDKMAQAPFFFDLSGGAHGQAGMQYMTGEVSADQLDQEKDFVGTDRQGVLWAEPMPATLLEWGQAKVRETLSSWAKRRREANEERLVQVVTKVGGTSVESRISRLTSREQKEAKRVLRQLSTIESVTDDPERARDLVDLVLRAFEDSSFFALLRALKDTSKAEREEVLKLVTELDVFETVKMAEVVRGRVGVIRKFREMLQEGVPEKPDMQDFLFKHPWLIDPEWIVVEHEKGLERLLIEQFKITPDSDPNSSRRVDFFCIGTRGRYLVVEVKRPKKPIGEADVTQIIRYVEYLRQHAPTFGQGQSPNHFEGVLVGHHLSSDGLMWRDVAAKSNIVIRPWSELLDVAERIHRDFLRAMKARAPDDSRIQDISAEPGAGPDNDT